jgi:hypothetical protein
MFCSDRFWLAGILSLIWRYRLGARTSGSQPENPGSIPGTATILLSSLQEFLDLPQDAGEHRRRKASGLRVLLAGVIGSEQPGETCRQNEARAVREPVRGARCNHSLSLQKVEIRVESDASEGQDRARVNELQFLFEIGQAVPDFFGQRLVIGWRAANRGGNQCVLEDEAVIGIFRVRLIGEACAMELLVQEIPRAVAREHAARTVGAVRGGREPDDDEVGFGIAKGRHGTAPVGPIAIRAALGARDFLAVLN